VKVTNEKGTEDRKFNHGISQTLSCDKDKKRALNLEVIKEL
jgi:hypothetical protein